VEELQLQPLSQHRLGAVADVLAAAFGDDSDQAWPALLRREADGGRLDMACSLVAVAGGALVGASLTNRHPCGRARVGATGVVPGARRRGVGRRMVGDVLRLLDVAGARFVTLEVAPDNVAAIALYEDLGFVAGRSLRVLASRRSDLRAGAVKAERVTHAEALDAMVRLHEEEPAYQRRRFYVETFRDGIICHGVRGGDGGLVGVVMQRGRAVLDYGARPVDDEVVRALAMAAAEATWAQRLINVVSDDPVGDALVRVGFSVESDAVEMVRVRP